MQVGSTGSVVRTHSFTQRGNHHISLSTLNFTGVAFGSDGHLISFQHSATDNSIVRISNSTFTNNTNAFVQLLNLDTAATVPSRLQLVGCTF